MQTAMNSNDFFAKNQEILKMLSTACLTGLAGVKKSQKKLKTFYRENGI